MKRIWLALCLLLVPLICQASKWDIFLMGGPAFFNLSNDSYIHINQYMLNEYKAESQSQARGLYGIGVAHTFEGLNKPLSLSLGLSGYYLDYGTVNGTEYPFVDDGIFDSLDYKFHARSLSTMFESRFIYTQFKWQPYALAGIGVSWNRLYKYNEIPGISSDSAAASLYPFPSKTRDSFAYELGLGVQRQIFINSGNPFQYFLLLEYRYINNGKAEFDLSSVQTTSDRLQVSNLNTQAIMFSLKVTV
jgi:opacity protein-like surface antigen